MVAAKRKGMVLLWFRCVEEIATACDPNSRPAKASVTLVAHYRVMHADPDGRSCYPSQARLAHLSGLKRDTVGKVDAWLVSVGLMTQVATRRAGLKEFHLEIPDTGSAAWPEDDPEDFRKLAPGSGAVTPTVLAPFSVDPLGDPGDDPPGGHNLRPPTVREEKEASGVIERSPHGAPLAPSTFASKVMGSVASASDASIRLTAELCAAIDELASAGWHADVVVFRSVRILAQAQRPSAGYLAEGLRREVLDGPVLPGWARFANAEASLRVLRSRLDEQVGTAAADRMWDENSVNAMWADYPANPDERDLVRMMSPEDQDRFAEVGAQALARLTSAASAVRATA
jgi:hypothetical protein